MASYTFNVTTPYDTVMDLNHPLLKIIPAPGYNGDDLNNVCLIIHKRRHSKVFAIRLADGNTAICTYPDSDPEQVIAILERTFCDLISENENDDTPVDDPDDLYHSLPEDFLRGTIQWHDD